MNPLKLNDGTEIINLSEEEKKSFEKEFGDFLTAHNVVIVPTLVKEVSALQASIQVFKKVKKDEPTTDTKTEESGGSDSGESVK